MKTLKTIIPLILLFVSSFGFGQIVNIPDAYFKADLIAQGIDVNSDGEIQESEALNVNSLILFSSPSDLEGIQYFTNLVSLDCINNSLTLLDLTQNINLTSLNCNTGLIQSLFLPEGVITVDCEANQLTSLYIPASVESINCRDNQLSAIDVTNNVNLEYFDCDLNQLTTLDVSQNLALLELMCGGNMLTTLDVTQNYNLYHLGIYNNQLSAIDISQNLSLNELRIQNNQFSTLDISQNLALEALYIDNNSITSLDYSQNLGLKTLSLSDNPFTVSQIDVTTFLDLEYLYCRNLGLSTLDISQNLLLKGVKCGDNQLTNIDVSQNVFLEFLYCDYNQLTEIDISNNPLIIGLLYFNNPNLISVNQKNGSNLIDYDQIFSSLYNATNCPSLQYVCVDEDEVVDLNNYFFSEGITVNVNSYCSFNPGGNYNTITGTATLDIDNNGCQLSDPSFPFLKLNINDGTETGSTFTTNSGEYNFYTQDGTFTVTPDVENPTFFNATPIDATINFPDTNNNIATQDLCITANGVHNDVEVVIAPTIPARPGFDAEYLITYKNKGNQTLSGDFSFNYNDAVLDFLIATEVPTILNSGQLTWDYTNLLPFESRSVYVTLNVNGPTETPAINIDDVLDFTVVINPIAGDELPNDNTFNYSQTVVGSYDPNDITCIEGDFVEPTEIGEYLHYIINFENTGNFPAENVVVATEIDPTMFDVSSLRVLSSSHDAYVKVTDNLVEIIFQSIYLSSGGHGNILLKVQTQDVLVEDDTVTKNANIYFDYNFPIETNNANTTFALLSNPEFEIDQSVSIYPNPVEDWVTISANQNIKSVSLFDVQGRVLQTKINASQEVKIDLSTRANGVYFLKITTDKGVKVEKIIKQ